MKKLINAFVAMAFILSTITVPLAILLVTHSSLGKFETVTILVMDLLIFFVCWAYMKKEEK